MHKDLTKFPHFGHNIILARHGETEWSKLGKHTGTTDIDLTENGEMQARMLQKKLEKYNFSKVFVSPLKRALKTCEICGLLKDSIVSPYLSEWDYGIYEGKTTENIRKSIPNWTIFTHEIKDGESLKQVFARAQKMIDEIINIPGDVVLFSSGHILRVLAACWIGRSSLMASHLSLSTASFSKLGYEHETPVIKIWNETHN